MKLIITLILTIFNITLYSQKIPELQPELGKLIDKSLEGEIEFIRLGEQCEKFWISHQDNFDEQKLTISERNLYNQCNTKSYNYWDIFDGGCSWYCGGGQDTISASSTLKSMKGIGYSVKNIHDLSYKTAWIEGVPGYGIGENITYHFPPLTPRITKIIIINGYIKSEKAWKENSRVKKLKMYLNNVPYAILNLTDTRYEQIFNMQPLGYGDRKNWMALEAKPWWTIKFEIIEVFEGEKYDDTAISEIYFDGIDVH